MSHPSRNVKRDNCTCTWRKIWQAWSRMRSPTGKNRNLWCSWYSRSCLACKSFSLQTVSSVNIWVWPVQTTSTTLLTLPLFLTYVGTLVLCRVQNLLTYGLFFSSAERSKGRHISYVPGHLRPLKVHRPQLSLRWNWAPKANWSLMRCVL